MTARHDKTGAAGDFSETLGFEATTPELKQSLERAPERFFVVDIRTPEAYAAGHIPGARNIPLEELAAEHVALPAARTVVTYCGDDACGQALLAALQLAQKGFRARSLIGGLTDWRRRGYPVETSPRPPAP